LSSPPPPHCSPAGPVSRSSGRPVLPALAGHRRAAGLLRARLAKERKNHSGSGRSRSLRHAPMRAAPRLVRWQNCRSRGSDVASCAVQSHCRPALPAVAAQRRPTVHRLRGQQASGRLPPSSAQLSARVRRHPRIVNWRVQLRPDRHGRRSVVRLPQSCPPRLVGSAPTRRLSQSAVRFGRGPTAGLQRLRFVGILLSENCWIQCWRFETAGPGGGGRCARFPATASQRWR
uniref:Os06g0622000 protein n=1 Tax=Macrostomum lignano TaxID=282301 RepID=A0A1I8H656_9PLAT